MCSVSYDGSPPGFGRPWKTSYALWCLQPRLMGVFRMLQKELGHAFRTDSAVSCTSSHACTSLVGIAVTCVARSSSHTQRYRVVQSFMVFQSLRLLQPPACSQHLGPAVDVLSMSSPLPHQGGICYASMTGTFFTYNLSSNKPRLPYKPFTRYAQAFHSFEKANHLPPIVILYHSQKASAKSILYRQS